MNKFTSLEYTNPDAMMFGRSLHPIRCGYDLVIGNGAVLPEVNYTLPPMDVTQNNVTDVLKQYEAMVSNILERMVTLDVPGVLLEFEHTPQMTDIIEIGSKVTGQTKRLMKQFFEGKGLKSALRVTVCDVRDEERPPRMRSGKAAQKMFKAFEENAKFGADLLSIESTGGKEVSDRALLEADIPGLLFALGILAPRDMHYLWQHITSITQSNGTFPAGDTACGFANTAMVLADRNYIPSVLAAVIRAMSAVRSLVAFEEGAIGPSKDCAYEGPVIKAITGFPISMEGKSSACAHFSHVGNIASAVCDLWSNESVQNVKLLSGFAPEVFSEILAYDCRLMNNSLSNGAATTLQKLMIESDEYKSVHALIISPNSSFKIAKAIVQAEDDFQRVYQAGISACQIIRNAIDNNKLTLSKREIDWLNRVEDGLANYSNEKAVMNYGLSAYGDLILAEEYGL